MKTITSTLIRIPSPFLSLFDLIPNRVIPSGIGHNRKKDNPDNPHTSCNMQPSQKHVLEPVHYSPPIKQRNQPQFHTRILGNWPSCPLSLLSPVRIPVSRFSQKNQDEPVGQLPHCKSGNSNPATKTIPRCLNSFRILQPNQSLFAYHPRCDLPVLLDVSFPVPATYLVTRITAYHQRPSQYAYGQRKCSQSSFMARQWLCSQPFVIRHGQDLDFASHNRYRCSSAVSSGFHESITS